MKKRFCFIWTIKLSLVLMLLILCLSSFIVNAGEKVTIPDTTNGGVIYHYKTTNPVYINSEYQIKDSDFRGVWVSPYVSDISAFTSVKQYKDQMYNVFDTMEAYHLNALVFHVRIMNDALYPSAYCERSPYMDTDVDMLPWIIDECHKRGIEFHAWMNPYRVTTNVSKTLEQVASSFKANNVASNPENLLKGQNSIILDPGQPIVRSWLVKVCMEVVENYDVDAIHFDDYFYDNGVDDSTTRAQYNSTNLSLADFRRKQVDMFIENLSSAIRAYNQTNNKRVQLGISPSGVYTAGNGVVTYDANGNARSTGSATASASFQHYGNYLYCDTLKWINNEWIDYILPQTYWACNHPSCPYADLMEWWSAVVKYKNVKCYSGIGIYQQNGGEGKYGWNKNPMETYYQIMITNNQENAHGVCFFKYSNIEAAVRDKSVTPKVNEIWSVPAILPEVNTMDIIPIGDVTNLKVSKTTVGNKISFNKLDDAKFYVIYRSESPLLFTPDEVFKVIGDLSTDGLVEYIDSDSSKNYYYGVRAQSYSNTLSNGIYVKASNEIDENLISLGELNDFRFAEALTVGSNVTLLFDPVYYPYGGKIKYEVNYKIDDKDASTITSFTSKQGYMAASIKLPNEFEHLTVTITAYNDYGKSVKTKVFNREVALPNITNFGVLTDMFSYTDATFVWNNCGIDDAEYVIQRSANEIDWEDLKTISSNSDKVNLTQKIRLGYETGIYSYRVVIKKDGLIGYSNVLKTNITNKLGDIKNVTINGDTEKDLYVVKENSNIVITFKKLSSTNATTNYSISVSSDLSNWISLASYNRRANISENDTTVTVTIPVASSKYLLYIKIKAIAGEYLSSEKTLKFYCGLDFMYSDEVLGFFYDNATATIKEMGLFN